MVEDYKSPTIPAILRTAPEMEQIIKGIRKLFTVNAEGECLLIMLRADNC
jgi:hypothetical protein